MTGYQPRRAAADGDVDLSELGARIAERRAMVARSSAAWHPDGRHDLVTGQHNGQPTAIRRRVLAKVAALRVESAGRAVRGRGGILRTPAIR